MELGLAQRAAGQQPQRSLTCSSCDPVRSIIPPLPAPSIALQKPPLLTGARALGPHTSNTCLQEQATLYSDTVSSLPLLGRHTEQGTAAAAVLLFLLAAVQFALIMAGSLPCGRCFCNNGQLGGPWGSQGRLVLFQACAGQRRRGWVAENKGDSRRETVWGCDMKAR